MAINSRAGRRARWEGVQFAKYLIIHEIINTAGGPLRLAFRTGAVGVGVWFGRCGICVLGEVGAGIGRLGKQKYTKYGSNQIQLNVLAA